MTSSSTDDRVAVRYTTRARHVGELFGAAPSGRTVTFTGIEVYRLLEGKIVEYWGEANMSDLFASSAEPERARELTRDEAARDTPPQDPVDGLGLGCGTRLIIPADISRSRLDGRPDGGGIDVVLEEGDDRPFRLRVDQVVELRTPGTGFAAR